MFQQFNQCLHLFDTKVGLEYIFGQKKQIDQIQICTFLREIQFVAFKVLKVDFIKFDNRSLSLKEIEHSLCEFHKYVNSTYGNKSSSYMRMYNPREYSGIDRAQKQQLLNGSPNCDYCNDSVHHINHTCDTCGRSYCDKCIGRKASVRDDPKCLICDECKDIAVTLNPSKKMRYSI